MTLVTNMPRGTNRFADRSANLPTYNEPQLPLSEQAAPQPPLTSTADAARVANMPNGGNRADHHSANLHSASTAAEMLNVSEMAMLALLAFCQARPVLTAATANLHLLGWMMQHQDRQICRSVIGALTMPHISNPRGDAGPLADLVTAIRRAA